MEDNETHVLMWTFLMLFLWYGGFCGMHNFFLTTKVMLEARLLEIATGTALL